MLELISRAAVQRYVASHRMRNIIFYSLQACVTLFILYAGSQLLMDPSQMTAAERAAAAAARIPDPAPRPRRIKRKSLSWKPETDMTAVRWFRKVSCRRACYSGHSTDLPKVGLKQP